MTRTARIQAGIDEAGLGPILGPLVMGWSVFRSDEEPDLWRALDAVVSQEPNQDSDKLIVTDSKVVFTRNPRGEKRLERTALGFLGQLEDAPRTPRELILRTPGAMRASEATIERHPWYATLGEELPVFEERDSIERCTQSLSAAGARSHVALLSAGACVHPAGALNDSYQRTQNKARTLWENTAPILEHLWEHFAHRGLDVTVDRQGGRLHYASFLLATFPMAHFECLREGRDGSEYRLRAKTENGERDMRILFVEKADRGSFPVALASCLAKYARELCMGAFNRYFEAKQPGLRPTAGYTTDGRRWIRDAESTIREAAIDKRVLIRER